MIKYVNLQVPLEANEATIKTTVASKLKITPVNITKLNIIKKSVDARTKQELHFVVSVEVGLNVDEQKVLSAIKDGNATICPPPTPYIVKKVMKRPLNPPVVVGSGPCGLFAALYLAEAGLNPIVLERGADVDARKAKVESFWSTGTLDTKTNVQFGEGGAGTFSDGKLTTNIKDSRCQQVLTTFVKYGAPDNITYEAKPHIGTDKLTTIVKAIREQIINLGGQVRFLHQLTDIIYKNNAIRAIKVTDGVGTTYEIPTDRVILAIGHSARDTVTMLHQKRVILEQKAFSVGVRVEHPQKLIDNSQYGKFAGHVALGAADYKLVSHLKNGRSAYTFCMCPGGTVVAAASEAGGVVTNGMSVYARDGINANSALLIGVEPTDFGSTHPLAGIQFQRKWEQQAYVAGGSNYRAPAQLMIDFMNRRASKAMGSIAPSYAPGVTPSDLRSCLPSFVCESLHFALPQMNARLEGFLTPDAVMTGIETRSSSPFRIPRGESYQASISGLYPAGEGAGYAGGIVSAAVDGLRCAEALANELSQ